MRSSRRRRRSSRPSRPNIRSHNPTTQLVGARPLRPDPDQPDIVTLRRRRLLCLSALYAVDGARDQDNEQNNANDESDDPAPLQPAGDLAGATGDGCLGKEARDGRRVEDRRAPAPVGVCRGGRARHPGRPGARDGAAEALGERGREHLQQRDGHGYRCAALNGETACLERVREGVETGRWPDVERGDLALRDGGCCRDGWALLLLGGCGPFPHGPKGGGATRDYDVLVGIICIGDCRLQGCHGDCGPMQFQSLALGDVDIVRCKGDTLGGG